MATAGGAKVARVMDGVMDVASPAAAPATRSCRHSESPRDSIRAAPTPRGAPKVLSPYNPGGDLRDPHLFPSIHAHTRTPAAGAGLPGAPASPGVSPPRRCSRARRSRSRLTPSPLAAWQETPTNGGTVTLRLLLQVRGDVGGSRRLWSTE